MKKRTYYILGYGICVSNIKGVTIEKVAELIHSAPQFERQLYLDMLEDKMSPYTKTDYLKQIDLAMVLQSVIAENGVELTIAINNDMDDMSPEYFLLLPPSYPWEKDNTKISLEELTTILNRFTAIISDEKVDVQFFDYGSTS